MKKKQSLIYLDYAAGVPLDSVVFDAMKPFLTENHANPSALYRDAVDARNAIDQARGTVSAFLHTTPDCVIFSRGGTHSINMAIIGAALRHKESGKHIITTAVEHSAVRRAVGQLEKEGFEVTYLPVDEHGTVSLADVKAAIRKDTILITIMYANNEIGTIEPVQDIGKYILQYRKKNNTSYPLFHTDACQAAGSLDMSVERLHADLLSFNGSKIGGPKGVAVLYKRRGIDLEPISFGGGQEFGLSAGTEDVAGIVGLGSAVEQVTSEQVTRTLELRDYLWNRIQENIEDVVLNGPGLGEHRLANNLNVSFLGAESEAVILYLDAALIAVSSGSACTTDSDEYSHVLEACGYDEARMKSSIRFSLGKQTTKKEIKTVLSVLPGVIEQVRNMHP